MSLYKKLRERYDHIYDLFYFKVRKRLMRSALLTPGNLLTSIAIFIVLVLISGGVVALTDPVAGALFAKGSGLQSTGETFIFFFLNAFSLLGLILMEKGLKKTTELSTFILGLFFFLSIFLINWYIMVEFKGISP